MSRRPRKGSNDPAVAEARGDAVAAEIPALEVLFDGQVRIGRDEDVFVAADGPGLRPVRTGEGATS